MNNYQKEEKPIRRNSRLVIALALFAPLIYFSIVPQGAEASSSSLTKKMMKLNKKIATLEEQIAQLERKVSDVNDSRSAFWALPIQYLQSGISSCPKFSRYMGLAGKTLEGEDIRRCESIFYVREPFN